jgi:hypothetical protein
MEAIYFSETSGSLRATWLYNPEYRTLYGHRSETYKSSMYFVLFAFIFRLIFLIASNVRILRIAQNWI